MSGEDGALHRADCHAKTFQCFLRMKVCEAGLQGLGLELLKGKQALRRLLQLHSWQEMFQAARGKLRGSEGTAQWVNAISSIVGKPLQACVQLLCQSKMGRDLVREQEVR